MLINEKIGQAAALLRELGIDCWLTFTRESCINGDPVLPYLAPADVTWHSVFIVGVDGKARAIVGQYDKQAIEETGAYEEVTGYVTGFSHPLQDCLKKLNPASIAVNYSRDSEICDGLTHGMYLTLVDVLHEIGMDGRLASAERLVSSLRERKSPGEIAAIRAAIKHTGEIYAMVRDFIAVGRSEREIAGFMTKEMQRRGLAPSWGAATCPSVFTGPDTAAAHYGPTDRRVEPGHLLNMDFGVTCDHYCSDLQRTFFMLPAGEREAPESVRRGFSVVVEAIEAARLSMRPGISGFMADAVARDLIVAAGYEEFPHALGHQVGRYAHDGTALLGPTWEKYAQKPMKKLEAGMVFTLEPRLTVPGHGTVTIEEMVLVTESGAEWLGPPQKELYLIKS